MRTDYYVYALVNPKTNKIFYVGKGTGNRCKQHLTDKESYAANKKLNGYVRNLIKDNQTPHVIKLHDNLDEETAYIYEENLIKFYGRKGMDDTGILLNILESGRPPSFSKEEHPWWGRNHTEETKNKISQSKKEYYKTNKHSMLGKFLSEETKRKISESKKGKKRTPEQVKKFSDSVRGFKQSKYQKQKAKEANSCWWKVIDVNKNKEYFTQDLKSLSKDFGYGEYKLLNIYYGRVKPKGIQVIKMTEKGQPLQ